MLLLYKLKACTRQLLTPANIYTQIFLNPQNKPDTPERSGKLLK